MNDAKYHRSNEPGRYDKARVATLKPVRQAIERLALPPIHLRKLLAICNALEMQIEDGGDNREVNSHLLEALRAAVVHQVGQEQASVVLRAIDKFAKREAKRGQ